MEEKTTFYVRALDQLGRECFDAAFLSILKGILSGDIRCYRLMHDNYVCFRTQDQEFASKIINCSRFPCNRRCPTFHCKTIDYYDNHYDMKQCNYGIGLDY